MLNVEGGPKTSSFTRGIVVNPNMLNQGFQLRARLISLTLMHVKKDKALSPDFQGSRPSLERVISTTTFVPRKVTDTHERQR
jgi:hypothetical protein